MLPHQIGWSSEYISLRGLVLSVPLAAGVLPVSEGDEDDAEIDDVAEEDEVEELSELLSSLSLPFLDREVDSVLADADEVMGGVDEDEVTDGAEIEVVGEPGRGTSAWTVTGDAALTGEAIELDRATVSSEMGAGERGEGKEVETAVSGAGTAGSSREGAEIERLGDEEEVESEDEEIDELELERWNEEEGVGLMTWRVSSRVSKSRVSRKTAGIMGCWVTLAMAALSLEKLSMGDMRPEMDLSFSRRLSGTRAQISERREMAGCVRAADSCDKELKLLSSRSSSAILMKELMILACCLAGFEMRMVETTQVDISL